MWDVLHGIDHLREDIVRTVPNIIIDNGHSHCYCLCLCEEPEVLSNW
jgi:hypothetical protein